MISLISIFRVWQRYLAVFRKNIVYALVTTFVEPFLYLLSFGFGLGSMIGAVNLDGQAIPYRAFVLAGIVAQTLLFQGFFEAAYGSFIRMYYQKIFQAIAVTPVTLSEVLWGELIWDSSRATLSAGAVLMVGVAIGDFPWLGALAILPFCFFFAMIFAALGLWVAAKSRTIESISYPQYLLVFPMFLFCGVFFPLTNLPVLFQKAAWALPLTPVLSMMRSFTLGAAFDPKALLILILWVAVLVPLARRAMIRRLLA
ncbi:MAG TPA: ABC transporter permease [Bdellovibrionales bacterium]|nr:MAG: hypothetical protein A2Z97_09070 [Bdellovibrionales bacterium GWB1_52_6]OFZ06306.1 MAG: hypothetical protein A2X97_02470 [Bdellovibrionales bacterium GWA1_52_35]OFZ36147.1 MAG: hypothetical protein A2070_04480 [Bdellovibrionales bacterium GWC1_52_8]HAR42047.1 ABC transporter permease [Bdellovibrionales bacterium]HCM40055.1 ABC transporter permease [Bdellovibrionales bacterium]